MIIYYYEYDAGGTILNTRMTNGFPLGDQTVDDPANTLYTMSLDGTESSAMMTDVCHSQGDPVNHRILSNAMKRVETVFPSTLMGMGGLTVSTTIANFQEQGGLAVALDNNTDTSCVVSFAAPSQNLFPFLDAQLLGVQVGQFDTGQTGVPTVRLEVWELNGLTPVASSAEIPVTSGSQYVSFTWDATALTLIDGSTVEARVFGTRSGGGAAVMNSVNLGPFHWQWLRDTLV